MIRRRDFIAGLGAAAWPLATRAQQPNLLVIGTLDWRGPQPNSPPVKAFRDGLAEAGFIEGRNLSIESRWAKGDFRQLRNLAANLVRHQVAVIVAGGALGPPLAAKEATSTIRIVFSYSGDPVTDGLVASLNRPGSNVTGITLIDTALAGKRLDLLLKMVPQTRKVGFISGDHACGRTCVGRGNHNRRMSQ